MFPVYGYYSTPEPKGQELFSFCEKRLLTTDFHPPRKILSIKRLLTREGKNTLFYITLIIAFANLLNSYHFAN